MNVTVTAVLQSLWMLQRTWNYLAVEGVSLHGPFLVQVKNLNSQLFDLNQCMELNPWRWEPLPILLVLYWWEALPAGDMAQGIHVLKKNKSIITCNSADWGDRGKEKKKNQSHSLKNFSNGPWLFSSHWQSIVQYAGWATRWKQVVNISFSTAVGQTSLLKLTLAITGYKWQSVDLKPVTLLLLLKLLLLQLLNCTVEQGISLNLKLKTNHLEHHLVLKSPKTWIMEVPGDLYFLYSLY